jgi:hypothetical protein
MSDSIPIALSPGRELTSKKFCVDIVVSKHPIKMQQFKLIGARFLLPINSVECPDAR